MVDTPGAFPVIAENATVRIKVGMLVTYLGALVGFVFWLTTMHNTITHNSGRLERMEVDIREIKGDIKGLRGLSVQP